MQILPIDLTALVATILGISVVLIPVIGLTARFALKPTVEALGRVLERKGLDDAVQILSRRVELQEHLIDSLQTSLNQLAEASDFDRQIHATTPTRTLSAGGPDAGTPDEETGVDQTSAG